MCCNYNHIYHCISTYSWTFVPLCLDRHAALELGDADYLGRRAGYEVLADVGVD